MGIMSLSCCNLPQKLIMLLLEVAVLLVAKQPTTQISGSHIEDMADVYRHINFASSIFHMEIPRHHGNHPEIPRANLTTGQLLTKGVAL